jgi:hypothetical protein
MEATTVVEMLLKAFSHRDQTERGLSRDWSSKLAFYVRSVWKTARAWPLKSRFYAAREDLHSISPVALQSAILCEQVRILHETPAIFLTNVINASLVAYVLGYYYPRWLVVAWVASFLVIVSARLWNSWRYRRKPQSADAAPNWALRFTIGSTVTGCLWGLTASVVPLTGDPLHQAFVAFVVAGMTAGAVMSNSAYLPAIFGFAMPALIPLILVFFARADLVSATMGLMTTVYAVWIGLLSRRANGWITSVARHEIIRAALTADLEKQIGAIEYRNRLFHALSVTARKLLATSTLKEALPKVLEIVGRAVRADYVLLIELRYNASAEPLLASQCYWHSTDAPSISVVLNWEQSQTTLGSHRSAN